MEWEGMTFPGVCLIYIHIYTHTHTGLFGAINTRAARVSGLGSDKGVIIIICVAAVLVGEEPAAVTARIAVPIIGLIATADRK